MTRPALILLLAALAPTGSAAVFTVGPDGVHASLQSALGAALGAGAGPHQVRIQSGTLIGDTMHVQHVDIEIEISGGWNAAFGLRTEDPSLTVLQGSGTSRPLSLLGSLGQVRVENLSLTNPDAQENVGTCLLADASGTHSIILRDSVVRHCEGRGTGYCSGNGIWAHATQDGSIAIVGNRVHDNRCEPVRADASVRVSGRGTGIGAQTDQNGDLLIQDNLIVDNLARNHGEQSDGIGISVISYGEGLIELVGNRILRNRVIGTSVGEFTPVSLGWGLTLVAGAFDSGAEVVARGNLVAGNSFEANVRSGSQAYLHSLGSASIAFGDSAVLDGSGGFWALLVATDVPTARLDLVNLTVAGNEGDGIRAFTANGPLTLSNSIASGNQNPVDLHPAVIQTHNLLDVPAGFIDPAAGDYRLRADSPALDAGTASPPGGLGAIDVEGGQRLVGAAVDIGAFERGSTTVFAHGFEAVP